MNEKTLAMASERTIKRRKAQQLMADEVRQLMAEHQEQEGLTWTGSKIDLMEALYHSYETATITDDDGVPMPFMTMVRKCCRLLHVKRPANPYEAASRGRLRKGVKHLSYMDRYVNLMDRGCRNCLWKAISNVLP